MGSGDTLVARRQSTNKIDAGCTINTHGYKTGRQPRTENKSVVEAYLIKINFTIPSMSRVMAGALNL